MKRCPRCGVTKETTDFPRNRATKDGLATYSKPCHNEKMNEISERLYGGHRNFLRKKRYGITKEEMNSMIDAQGGVCAICGQQNPNHIDHDHKSKIVRGVLCFSCNRGLGKFEDDTSLLRQAIRYLKEGFLGKDGPHPIPDDGV